MKQEIPHVCAQQSGVLGSAVFMGVVVERKFPMWAWAIPGEFNGVGVGAHAERRKDKTESPRPIPCIWKEVLRR